MERANRIDKGDGETKTEELGMMEWNKGIRTM